MGGKSSQVAATKNHYLAALTNSDSFNADVIFLQECNFASTPQDYFSRCFPQFQAQGSNQGPPGSPIPYHDTVTLVKSSLTASIPLTDFCWSRVITTLLPDMGIALINLHGPPFASPIFFNCLYEPLQAIQSKGWSLIVAGDFNAAPLSCDWANADHSTSPAALGELMDSLSLIDLAVQQELQALEEQALTTTNFASVKIQITMAKKWVKKGDQISPWMAMMT
ncbi:hypothetical protein H4219_005367 [Mycoemilia scoparia]|uniref:Endonuclease/exonuclease/phosphatase domain-containing protein n=1 Tax=Mycoemilia scoparia TaxID=417184 RepID=A0A9W7ZN80_9FUNG|nr:hypothetical protein H4219_005367 [Mycoemilia scoparia]